VAACGLGVAFASLSSFLSSCSSGPVGKKHPAPCGWPRFRSVGTFRRPVLAHLPTLGPKPLFGWPEIGHGVFLPWSWVLANRRAMGHGADMPVGDPPAGSRAGVATVSDERGTPSGWGSEAKGLANRFAIGSGVAVTFLLFGLIVVPRLVRERRTAGASALRTSPPRPAWVGWIRPRLRQAGSRLTACDPATVMTPNPKLLGRGEVLSSRTAAHATARADKQWPGSGNAQSQTHAILPSPLTGSVAFT